MTTAGLFEKTKEEIAEKIRKLLTQAEDPAATPEEAQAFTMKAQQLRTKYSIELAMITDARRPGSVGQKGWMVSSPYAAHKVNLISAVARANDCRAIYDDLPGGRKHIDVVGYPQDLEWVETLSRSLELQLAAALGGAVRAKPARVHGRTFTVAFIQGFVTEVSNRLQAARRAAVAAAEAVRTRDHTPGAPSVALVLREKQQRVDDEFQVRHPRSRTVYRHIRLQSWSGYDPGREAGRRATLAKGSIGETRSSLTA